MLCVYRIAGREQPDALGLVLGSGMRVASMFVAKLSFVKPLLCNAFPIVRVSWLEGLKQSKWGFLLQILRLKICVNISAHLAAA
jgi:hypothetical protein